jgi:hypothetical protein
MAKIILTTDVANLGGPGDIVEVKDGYARNYLLPRGFAIPSSKGAEKNIATIRRAQESRRIHDLDHAKEVKLFGLGPRERHPKFPAPAHEALVHHRSPVLLHVGGRLHVHAFGDGHADPDIGGTH